MNQDEGEKGSKMTLKLCAKKIGKAIMQLKLRTLRLKFISLEITITD